MLQSIESYKSGVKTRTLSANNQMQKVKGNYSEIRPRRIGKNGRGFTAFSLPEASFNAIIRQAYKYRH